MKRYINIAAAFLLAGAAIAQQSTYKVGSVGLPMQSKQAAPSAQSDTKNFKAPKAQGYVNDYEHDLDSATIKTLKQICSAHHRKTKEEIIIVTVPSVAPFKDMSSYVKALSNAWGMGENGKNNNVLVVFSRTMHREGIGVGTGLYNKLTNEMSQKVINEKMLPLFQQKKFGEGFIAGTKELVRLLERV